MWISKRYSLFLTTLINDMEDMNIKTNKKQNKEKKNNIFVDNVVFIAPIDLCVESSLGFDET